MQCNTTLICPNQVFPPSQRVFAAASAWPQLQHVSLLTNERRATSFPQVASGKCHRNPTFATFSITQPFPVLNVQLVSFDCKNKKLKLFEILGRHHHRARRYGNIGASQHLRNARPNLRAPPGVKMTVLEGGCVIPAAAYTYRWLQP